MGDTENGEKARKMVFVTVGTTLFDAVVRAVDSWEVKQELLKRGYTNLVIQMGRGSYTPTKYLEMGSEPSPIDCFKKFHTKKDGKEWATDHAKTLYGKMDAIKAKAVSEGIKAKDVYGLTSSGKGCSKRCREDFTKEKEDLEAHLREEMDSKLAKVVEKFKEKFAQSCSRWAYHNNLT
nr:udp-n-acetylglucosamine transferase subunit alg13 like [Quercus suber]